MRFRLTAAAPRALAIGVSLTLAGLYSLAASAEPAVAAKAFFLGPFSSAYSFQSLMESAAPLLVCALGAAMAFRSGAFNLGGEGQAAIGSLAAAGMAAALGKSGLPPVASIALVLAAGAAAGAALAALSALAERWSGAEILLTSFLLSQAALVTVDWAIGGPLRDASSNLLAMPRIADSLRLPRLAPPSALSAAAPISLVLALAAAALWGWSRLGYELRIHGGNRGFARAAGLDDRLGLFAMSASGALHGLAGGLLVLGPSGRAMKGMTGGVGWNGLAVALVAGSSPLGCVPAALYFAWLDAGARQSSIMADLSPDASAIMKAAALFLITASLALPRRPRGGVPGRGSGGEGRGEGQP